MPEQLARFLAEHLDPCTDLYMAVFNGPPWHDRWTRETARRRLSDLFHTPGFAGWVLMDAGEPLGFAAGRIEQWYDAQHYYLAEMCVRTEIQGRGIGSRLIARMEQELVTMGVDRAYLLTMTGGQAEAFYTKNGYRTSMRMIMMAHRLDR